MRQRSGRGLGISTYFDVEVSKIFFPARLLSMPIGASQKVVAIRPA